MIYCCVCGYKLKFFCVSRTFITFYVCVLLNYRHNKLCYFTQYANNILIISFDVFLTSPYIYIYIFIFSVFFFSVETRWICPNNCGRYFKNKINLNRHLMNVCGVQRLYTCGICFKKFKRKDSLKTHYICVHKLLDFSKSVARR